MSSVFYTGTASGHQGEEGSTAHVDSTCETQPWTNRGHILLIKPFSSCEILDSRPASTVMALISPTLASHPTFYVRQLGSPACRLAGSIASAQVLREGPEGADLSKAVSRDCPHHLEDMQAQDVEYSGCCAV